MLLAPGSQGARLTRWVRYALAEEGSKEMLDSARVFVSHASEDKLTHVRPLVEALLRENVPLWLDRPGAGDNNFGFDDAFIRMHDIAGIAAGSDWNEALLAAHRSSGAVLACLSRALCSSRQVLVQELALARYANKLVTCIVDDLPFDQMPRNLGMLDASKLQSPRVDSALLRQAVDALDADPRLTPEALPPLLHQQWEIVRRLVADIRKILVEKGIVQISPADIDKARAQLRLIPVGPMVNPFEIPFSLIELLAQRVAHPVAAMQHFTLAMQLADECRDPHHTARQTVVSSAEVIPLEGNSPINYWTAVLALAGHKSRRTLAALLIAPGYLSPPIFRGRSKMTSTIFWPGSKILKPTRIRY